MRTTVTAGGRITIPREIRARLSIGPGDEIELVCDGVEVRLRKAEPSEPFTQYRGFLKHLAGRETVEIVEEMRGR